MEGDGGALPGPDPTKAARAGTNRALGVLWTVLPGAVWLLSFSAELTGGPVARPLLVSAVLIVLGAWARLAESWLAKPVAARRDGRRSAVLPLFADCAALALAAFVSIVRGGLLPFAAILAVYGGIRLLVRVVVSRAWSLLGTTVYLAAGAFLLAFLGPGIAPVGHPVGRPVLGLAMISLAWAGWTAIHPGARRAALSLLLSRRS